MFQQNFLSFPFCCTIPRLSRIWCCFVKHWNRVHHITVWCHIPTEFTFCCTMLRLFRIWFCFVKQWNTACHMPVWYHIPTGITFRPICCTILRFISGMILFRKALKYSLSHTCVISCTNINYFPFWLLHNTAFISCTIPQRNSPRHFLVSILYCIYLQVLIVDAIWLRLPNYQIVSLWSLTRRSNEYIWRRLSVHRSCSLQYDIFT